MGKPGRDFNVYDIVALVVACLPSECLDDVDTQRNILASVRLGMRDLSQMNYLVNFRNQLRSHAPTPFFWVVFIQPDGWAPQVDGGLCHDTCR